VLQAPVHCTALSVRVCTGSDAGCQASAGRKYAVDVTALIELPRQTCCSIHHTLQLVTARCTRIALIFIFKNSFIN